MRVNYQAKLALFAALGGGWWNPPARARLPGYAAIITFWNLGLAFAMVVLIAAVSSYIGIRKVLRIEPCDIFRG